jgi:dihydrofolate reductase
MIGMIAAVSPDGVIGVDGKIPWHYPADLKRFKSLTLDGTIIMGRVTYESIGKPLPKRRNVVITSRDIPGVECFRDIPSALATCTGNVWFIGGASIYREAMRYADLIDLTYVPDQIEREDAVRFPEIDQQLFEPGPRERDPDDPRLEHRIYRRRRSSSS